MQINLVWLHWSECATCFSVGTSSDVFILEIKILNMNNINLMHTDPATWNPILSDWQKNRVHVRCAQWKWIKKSNQEGKCLERELPCSYSTKSSHRTTPGVPFAGWFRLSLGMFVNQNHFWLVRRGWEQIRQFYLGEIRWKLVPRKTTKQKRNSQASIGLGIYSFGSKILN